MSEQKSRNWCFTLNNYEIHLNGLMVEPPSTEINNYLWTLITRLGSVKYMIIGFETCPTTGTPHIQGYVDFVNPRTITGIRRIIPQISWRKRLGTWSQATEYCKKDGNFFEWGEPNKQGQRADLTILKENIAAGTKVDDIVMNDPVAYHQYGRTLNKIEDLAMRKRFRTEMTTGTWYWGRTGVGKSHRAFEGYSPETHYVFPNDNGWWDGYVQQPTVIFNDFRGELPYNELLQLIDKWPHTVRRRNREPIPFISRHVIITSSIPPEEVYWRTNERDQIQQLLRRLTVIEVVADPGTEVVGGVILDPPHHLENTSQSDEEHALRAQSVEPMEKLEIITPDEFTKALKQLKELTI